MENKSSFKNTKVGDYLSEVQYYKVKEKIGNTLVVINERNFEFSISSQIIEEGIYNAGQFTVEKPVTRTELIEIFSSARDTVFTVSYHKQPKVEDINEAIELSNKGKILPIKDLKLLIKGAYKGVERVLVGYMVKVETGFGRSMVVDLEADRSKSTENWDSRLRQVDHRTLNWLIYRGVKYTVK